MPYEEMTESPELETMIDQEAEQAFLGNIMAEPKSFDAAAWMKPEFFGVPVHGAILAAIKQLRQQGRDFGPQYLSQFFGSDPDLQAAGGPEYLKNITALAFAPSTVKDLAAHILSLHYRRMGFSVGNEIVKFARNASFDMPPEKLLDGFELILAQARALRTDDKTTSVGSVAAKALAEARNPNRGVYTGIGGLQRLTRGFQPSDLVILAGRPSMGKTAAGVTMAVNGAEAGKTGLFFSGEMDTIQLNQRILSRYAEVAIHSGEDADEFAAARAIERMSALPLHIDDTAGLTALDMMARASQFKRKHGKLDIVWIDHLHKIKSMDTRPQMVHQIAQTTGALKEMAKNLQIPVVLLCQLSRANEVREDKRPQLSDLRDSGAIEQDADVVIFVHREEYYLKQDGSGNRYKNKEAEGSAQADLEALRGKAEFIVAKVRQGERGTVYLNFSGRQQVFYE